MQIFVELIQTLLNDMKAFIHVSFSSGHLTICFFDPMQVKVLNEKWVLRVFKADQGSHKKPVAGKILHLLQNFSPTTFQF